MVEIDLTRERLDWYRTTVGRVTDTDDPWHGMVRIVLDLENAPSITLRFAPDDAEYLATLMWSLIEQEEQP